MLSDGWCIFSCRYCDFGVHLAPTQVASTENLQARAKARETPQLLEDVIVKPSLFRLEHLRIRKMVFFFKWDLEWDTL